MDRNYRSLFTIGVEIDGGDGGDGYNASHRNGSDAATTGFSQTQWSARPRFVFNS
jgi:hypothetical protein